MTAWVYSVVRNEAVLMPYWLRHYATFCERMIVYDDASDDETRDIVQAGGGELRQYPYSGLDDTQMVGFANLQYREARGQADWVIWVDADEFLYDPRIAEQLDHLKTLGVQLPTVRGYNMVADSPPSGSGQIYDEIKTGFFHDRYSKPCILDPTLEAKWDVGKHHISVAGEARSSDLHVLQLLHYRYLGREYHQERNARNFSRISELNRAARFGFEVTPGWDGEYSVRWYEEQRKHAEVVI
jgi:glycosyltransferase involved in cell wall biosynthesis